MKKPPPPIQEYYTVEEAAAVLGYSRATMYRLIARGEIPTRGVGRLRRVPRFALVMSQEGHDGAQKREIR